MFTIFSEIILHFPSLRTVLSPAYDEVLLLETNLKHPAFSSKDRLLSTYPSTLFSFTKFNFPSLYEYFTIFVFIWLLKYPIFLVSVTFDQSYSPPYAFLTFFISLADRFFLDSCNFPIFFFFSIFLPFFVSEISISSYSSSIKYMLFSLTYTFWTFPAIAVWS